MSAGAGNQNPICGPEQMLAGSINSAIQAIQTDITSTIASGTPILNLGQYENLQPANITSPGSIVMDDIIFNAIEFQFGNYEIDFNCQRFNFNDTSLGMPNDDQRNYLSRASVFGTIYDDLTVAGRVTAACW